jgi:hypothetical protein
MVCNLSDEELFILNLFYANRNLNTAAGYHLKKLKWLYSKKFSQKNSQKIDKSIKELKNRGYIAQIRKKEVKFYIPQYSYKEVLFSLDGHGYTVTCGKNRRE